MSEVESQDEARDSAEGAGAAEGAAEGLLSKIESSRRRVALRYTLPLLGVVLAGVVALFFIGQALVRQRLEQVRQLDAQIAAGRAEVEALRKQKADLESQLTETAGTVKAIQYAVQQAAEKGQPASAIEGAVEKTVASNPTVEAAAPSVYIHTRDEPQRTREARAAADALRRAGFAVGGIQRAPPSALPATEVRYFRPEDQALADKVVEALRTISLENKGARLSRSGSARPGQIELWLVPPPPPVNPELEAIRAKVRLIIASVTGAEAPQMTPESTLLTAGALSMPQVQIIRARIISEFGLSGSALSSLTPATKIDDLSQRVYEHLRARR